MQKIVPCLWFENQAEDAVKLYTSLFENSERGKASTPVIEFTLQGRKFTALNGGPHFKFTSGVSLFVWCNTEKEIDHLWKNLSSGGKVLMELKTYPWAEKYGWCEDKFGVAWQLMLSEQKRPLAPAFLFINYLFGKGEEAINFYVSQFKNSKIEALHRDPETNAVLHGLFSVEGQQFVLMEGLGNHLHQITGAISFAVNCKSQEEIDNFWQKLPQGGGLAGQCGWLTDRYGVHWQIVPDELGALMGDSSKSEKVMQALRKMKKLEVEKLRLAAQS